MGAKVGPSLWGRNIDLGFFRTDCWGRYLDLKGRKTYHGENCVIFIFGKAKDHWEDLGVGVMITLRWTLGR
jgi:hypothetical protein